jgi:protein-S-isoprenylcysteine O-methyltransferase Ste14
MKMEERMDDLVKIIVFVLLSLGIAWLSRRSLRDFTSHGFYRFFAWELILALVLLNLDIWFFRPLCWYQLISWPLLLVSMYLIIHAVVVLRRAGEHGAREEDPALIGIEKTTRLVTSGPYRYIRHPFYSSLLFLVVGVFFKSPSLPGGILCAAAVFMLVATAKTEEQENIAYFGEDYIRYMGVTKMFVPFIF